MRIAALSFLSLISVAPALAQDADAGRRVFGQCRACHQVGPEAKNIVGPKLNGLFGRKAGTIEGYQYTEANKNSGVIWDEKNFAEYIADPRKFMPGTKMVFNGLKREADIVNLIAYLKTFDEKGAEKK